MTGFIPRGPGDSPFDQFLAQFFGQVTPGRRAYSIDLTRLLSEQAPGLVAEAGSRAAGWGQRHLDTQHPLWAAPKTPPPPPALQRAGGDPRPLAPRPPRDRARRR